MMKCLRSLLIFLLIATLACSFIACNADDYEVDELEGVSIGGFQITD